METFYILYIAVDQLRLTIGNGALNIY